MKKLFVILLSVMMLLSTCALAEGMQFTLKNVVLETNGEMVLDLTGLEAVAAIAATDGTVGGSLDIYGNGSNLGGVVLAAIGRQALIQMNGGNSYVVDLPEVDLSSVKDQIEDATDGKVDVSELIAKFDGIATDGGVATVNGVEYQTTLIKVSEAQMAELLAKGSEVSDEVEDLEDIAASMEGAFYDGEGSDILDLTINMVANDRPVELSVNVEHTEDSGAHLVALNLTGWVDDESFGISADVEITETAGESWLPTDIGGAVELSLDELADSDGPLAQDAMAMAQSIAMSALSVVFSNQMAAGAE